MSEQNQPAPHDCSKQGHINNGTTQKSETGPFSEYSLENGDREYMLVTLYSICGNCLTIMDTISTSRRYI